MKTPDRAAAVSPAAVAVASLLRGRAAAGDQQPAARRVASQDRVRFTAQLAMMSAAGVSISQALDSLAKQETRPHVARVLRAVHDDVLSGSTFSGSLRRRPEMFDEAYVATIAAGEASGRMSEVLAQLADIQRSQQRLARTIRGMLMYPIVLTSASVGVITTLVVFVLPRFATIFEQYELTLPLITRALVWLAEEARSRWWLWGPLAVAAAAGAALARLTPTGRRAIDHAMVTAPGLGGVTRTLLGARVCRLLGLLLSSGVPLIDALRLLRRAETNSLFRDLTERLEESVTNGRSLSEGLEGNRVLPPSAGELIATAERTGRLGEVAQLMGAHYEEEGQAAARQLVSVIEPVVTIVMGGVVAVVVLAVMLPVFDIATLAQGR